VNRLRADSRFGDAQQLARKYLESALGKF